MFERAENHREAGKCYQKIGFHRHAAQAFLKGGAEALAAECLLTAFNEEGGVAGAKSEQKAKEMRGIAKKAAEILVKLERFEEAETMLVRSEAFGPGGARSPSRPATTNARPSCSCASAAATWRPRRSSGSATRSAPRARSASTCATRARTPRPSST